MNDLVTIPIPNIPPPADINSLWYFDENGNLIQDYTMPDVYAKNSNTPNYVIPFLVLFTLIIMAQ